jgi:hypothetical protein
VPATWSLLEASRAQFRWKEVAPSQAASAALPACRFAETDIADGWGQMH